MKIILFGGSGQIGFELQRSLAYLGKVFAPNRSELDLIDKIAVKSFLDKISPNLIINAAAWTDVNAAEKNKIIARRINVDFTKQISDYSYINNIKLIHYSTDYVYSGIGVYPWNENSPTEPLNFYGQTKLAGDDAIKQSGCEYLIFRTSWVYNAFGNNFMKKILDLARSKRKIDVVSDHIGAPTPARLIAQLTALTIHSKLKSGIYHLASKGETSWYEFARAILNLAKQSGESFVLDQKNINAISTSQIKSSVLRPLNSRLSIIKLEQALNIELPDWLSQLNLTFDEYIRQNKWC